MKRALLTLLSLVTLLLLVSCGNAADHAGEAKTPSGSTIMKGRNYQDVIDDFKDHGFTNVKTDPVEDLITGWLTDDGDVEKVSVGGDENYAPDKWVAADIEVVITYHTFPEKESTDSDGTSSVAADTESEIYDFELNDDGKSYTLIDYNYMESQTPETASIPSLYNGLPVTEIGSQAFYACDELEKVILPDSIVAIKEYAFFHCANLSEIVFSEQFRRIGEYAFEGCDSLKEVVFLQPVSVGFSAFRECENLETVNIANGLIEDYSFYSCPNLKTVTLGEGTMTIGGKAFQSCKALTTVNITSTIYEIGDSAFEYCSSLREINFDGTEEQFDSIKFMPWWNRDTGPYEVNFSNQDKTE